MGNSNLQSVDSTEIFPRKIVGQKYLEDTAQAVRDMFEVIAKQEDGFLTLKGSLESAYSAHIKQFEHSDFNDDVDSSRAQFYFNNAADEKRQLELLVSQSIEVLYGAILQIAKQVMSLAFKDKPPVIGRSIGTQTLSAVIWHGRNQAMHWENEFTEKTQYTQKCFETLAKECGTQFDVKQPLRNMAWDICKEIGWSSYENYEKDMQEILGA